MLYSLLYPLLSEPRIAWGLLILGFLVLVLPSLRRDRVYRSATLFAGLNAGIVAIVLFSGLLIVGPQPELIRELGSSFMIPLPSVYLSSLIIGATIVPQYLLSSPSFFRATLVSLISLVVYFLITLLVSRLIWTILLIATEGIPSWSHLQQMLKWLLKNLTQPDPLAVTLLLGPALGALIGATVIMRTSRDLTG